MWKSTCLIKAIAYFTFSSCYWSFLEITDMRSWKYSNTQALVDLSHQSQSFFPPLPVMLDKAKESIESRTLCSCCFRSDKHSSEPPYHGVWSCLYPDAPCSMSNSWIFLLLAGPGWLPYAESPRPSCDWAQYMSDWYFLLARLGLFFFKSNLLLTMLSEIQCSLDLMSTSAGSWKRLLSPNFRRSWVM